MGRESNPHRLARHWYDVDRLLTDAMAHPVNSVEAGNDLVRMKSVRWEQRGVDYEQALQGKLKLIPPREFLEKLAKDHHDAVVGQLFFINRRPDSFKEINDRLAVAQQEINARIAARYPVEPKG